MVNVSGAGSQPQNIEKGNKSEPVEKKTTLDKGVEFVHDKTKKGTIVGDHYIAAGALGVIGGVATVAGVAKIADKVPAVEKALELAFNKGTGGAVALASSVILAEDAVQSFKEGKSVLGGAEALGAAVGGLGGVELIGRKFDIPIAKEALTATGKFIGKNSMAIIGGGAVVGGGVAAVSGASDLKEGKSLKGAIKLASGTVGMLGGGELIGRQFGIKYLDRALTGPAKAIFTSKGGLGVSGVAIAGTGAAAGVDGVRRLTQNKGFVNDLVGTAEVTASIAAATGGTSLLGVAVGNETMKKAFTSSGEVIGGVALEAGAVALGKHTVKSMSEKGVTLLNTATGTGAVLMATGGAEVIADKFGIPVLNKAFSKTWEPVLGAGLGLASYKFGAGAVREVKEGNAGNAIGQGALSLVTGAGSAAVLGHALKIPGLETMGEKMLHTAGEIASPVFEFAVKNPFVTLGAVAVAGGAGAYAYYSKHKGDEKEVPKETPKAEAK